MPTPVDARVGRFPDHFSSTSESYRAFRPGYPAELYDRLVALCDRRHRAWDCASGSGQAAIELARHFTHVIATDASRSQLGRATPGSFPRVVALAEHAPLRDGSVDLVAVAQALHWFRFEPFFEEVRRVTRPGGLFAAWTYLWANVGPDVDAVMRDFREREVGRFWPPEREHVNREYRDIRIPFPEISMPEMEYETEMTGHRYLGYVGTWSAVQRARSVLDDDPIDRLRAPFEEAWGPMERPRTVTWPIRFRVARVEG